MRDTGGAFDGRSSAIGGGQVETVVLEWVTVNIRDVVPDLAASEGILQLSDRDWRGRIGVEGGRVDRNLYRDSSSVFLRVKILLVVFAGLDGVQLAVSVSTRPEIDGVFALVHYLYFAGCLRQRGEGWQCRDGERSANHLVQYVCQNKRMCLLRSHSERHLRE